MAHHVCPVWVGHLLASPLRKLRHDPRRILSPWVAPGMTALDVGPAMGFFSLPLAERVGPRGRVVCVDVQQAMLDRLENRARKAGVLDRIETRRCGPDSLGIGDLAGGVDFALLFAVVHEAENRDRLFREVRDALKPDGRALLAEPKGHVSAAAFAETLDAARAAGLVEIEAPRIAASRAAVLASGPAS